MMEVTYRDFRYFMRLLSRKAQLWTEMVVDDTILHNTETEKCDRFLRYNEAEHPIVCQLGGSDPSKLAQAAEIVQRYGYDEVNLNCGCPSSRVAGKGEFGCSLMKKKELVRDAIHAMSRAVQIPVTVKCRLGADDFDSPEFTRDFVRTVAQGGCKHFIIHARKAWLNGLSPAQNRTIPPLHYPRILDLCSQFPDLKFSINGGIADIGHARALLGFPHQRLDGETEELYSSAWGWPGVDVFSGSTDACPAVPPNLEGVMIGRGAMNTP
ncbi:dusA, partial [Symbiodinium pilosum]